MAPSQVPTPHFYNSKTGVYKALRTDFLATWLIWQRGTISETESSIRGNPTQTRLCSNKRFLEARFFFSILKVKVLYYPCSENKGADQLHSWSESLFSHMQKSGFLRTRLKLSNYSCLKSHISWFISEPNIQIYRGDILRFIGGPDIKIYSWARYQVMLVSLISRFIGEPDIKIYWWARYQD